jgi:hypothetical protein
MQDQELPLSKKNLHPRALPIGCPAQKMIVD